MRLLVADLMVKNETMGAKIKMLEKIIVVQVD